MKRISSLFLILFFILSSLFMQSCLFTSSASDGVNTKSFDVPYYRKAKSIKLQPGDEEAFKISLFGYEQTLFPNLLDLRVTDDAASKIITEHEKKLIDEGWRYQSSPIYDIWQKGDYLLFIAYDDNLSRSSLDNYRRSYGIEGLEAGQTLIISYVIDSSTPLPNPTMTALVEAWNVTSTAESLRSTQQAQEMIQKKTQQANEVMVQQTQEALQQAQQAMTLTQQAYTYQTQVAVSEAQKAESQRATSIALEPILDAMGSEFDGNNSLPAGMTIAREDHSRWDLESQSGWLHIIGRYISFYDENYIPKNVFVYPLQYTNISIITRVDGNMKSDGDSVWIALAPNTYDTQGYTVELGIAMDNNNGKEAYAWGCLRDSCSWGMDYEFKDPIRFSGPVYLRLDVQELKYTFYYSETGDQWVYLGEIEGKAAGDNLILAAGGGNNRKAEFDAYFDFIRFESLIENN